MSIKIRNARLEDIDQCFNLANVRELEIQGGGSPPKYWLKSIIEENQIFLVAEENGEVVGFRMGERIAGNIAFAHLLVVKKDKRGKGIGSILSKEFEKECKKRRLWLILSNVYAKNKKTISFFTKNGYKRGSLVYEFAKKIE